MKKYQFGDARVGYHSYFIYFTVHVFIYIFYIIFYKYTFAQVFQKMKGFKNV